MADCVSVMDFTPVCDGKRRHGEAPNFSDGFRQLRVVGEGAMFRQQSSHRPVWRILLAQLEAGGILAAILLCKVRRQKANQPGVRKS